MNSCGLANTGMPVGAMLVLALVLLLGGLAAYVVSGRRASGRSRWAGAGAVMVLLLVVAGVLGVVDGGGSPAQAVPSAATVPAAAASKAAAVPSAAEEDCDPGGNGEGGAGGGGGSGPDNSLTIIQTSVNTRIVPGAPATTLAGTITNHGTASAHITTVTVAIEAVTKAPGAVRGVCDASDYVLLDPAMPVGATLAPEQAAEFAGASIRFSDKGTNQDACKSATLTLRYTSS